ncbi:MAG: DUF4160 domain-containing protein [Deltaproteobacteria bacterium]|nr:DUF4160 domain-containing protein [Deltaproteobacteria bacterium]
MPEISRFFGIIVRLFYDDHNPPHIHAEFQGDNVVLDFKGNVLNGDLQSRTALRLLREWIDIRIAELEEDWQLAKSGHTIKPIKPLD